MTKDKLKKLEAAVSAFNTAHNSQGAVWDAYTDAEKAYTDARAASEFINAARDAAKIDYIAAGEALMYANKFVKDAEQSINEAK